MIKNNGIDIATKAGSTVRCIFAGEVTKVTGISGIGKVVIVKHGVYYTVYTNLKETLVNVGDKLATSEEIGYVLTDEAKKKTEVHFELWRMSKNGFAKLDPQLWLVKN